MKKRAKLKFFFCLFVMLASFAIATGKSCADWFPRPPVPPASATP
jgi:hypothetical protein